MLHRTTAPEWTIELHPHCIWSRYVNEPDLSRFYPRSPKNPCASREKYVKYLLTEGSVPAPHAAGARSEWNCPICQSARPIP